jgi:hypothetical protein
VISYTLPTWAMWYMAATVFLPRLSPAGQRGFFIQRFARLFHGECVGSLTAWLRPIHYMLEARNAGSTL